MRLRDKGSRASEECAGIGGPRAPPAYESRRMYPGSPAPAEVTTASWRPRQGVMPLVPALEEEMHSLRPEERAQRSQEEE